MAIEIDVRAYLNSIAVAIDQRHCGKLKAVLDLKPYLSPVARLRIKPSVVTLQLAETYLKHISLDAEAVDLWKQLVFCHYSCRTSLLNERYEEGCGWLLYVMQNWLSIYEGLNSAWLIPVTKTLAFNLVDVACLADEQAEIADPHLSAHKHCFEARGSLENAFAVICRSGRRSSGLAVSNALCKLYFKLDEIQMAVVFQTRVDSQLSLSFDEFPREDRITWKYYSGLVAMERLKFREAEECLSYALELSATRTRNFQKLLFLLIPLRLLYNESPREGVMERYGLNRLEPLVRAVRGANLKLLRSYLDQNASYLASMRIWALSQKLIHVVHRNILFKCHAFQGSYRPERESHKLDLRILAAGLRVSGMEGAEPLEALKVARGLIQKDMVCGYLASQQRVLVLAKTQPFPKLRNINQETGEFFVEAE